MNAELGGTVECSNCGHVGDDVELIGGVLPLCGPCDDEVAQFWDGLDDPQSGRTVNVRCTKCGAIQHLRDGKEDLYCPACEVRYEWAVER